MRERYPFKQDHVNSPGKWTTADEGIQYLKEVELLEIIYSDLKSDRVTKDPENAPSTRAMWRKVVNKISKMSPLANKKETQDFLGLVELWRMHSRL